MVIRCVLLDLDGVIRHFDPDDLPEVERAHGLVSGSLMAAAFEVDLLHRVITGEISRASWVELTGERVGSAAAAVDWLARRPTVDDEMLAIIDQLRARGVVVAVLTNGTDTIRQELADHGIAERFDAVFNSAEIGLAKPDPAVFAHVCRSLDVDPSAAFFTDDSTSKLTGAIEIGIDARLFEGIDTFRAHLAELFEDL